MTTTAFKTFTETQKKELRKTVFEGDHNLDQSPCFSDQGLIEILDSHPRDMIDVYTMGDDPQTSLDFRRGDLGDMSGAAILEAVKRGKLWVNVREFQHATAACMDIYKSLETELKAATPDFRDGSQKMKLLISSPKAHVAYHADTKDQFLIQVRGQKRVWLYPNTLPYVRDTEIEGIVLGEQAEEMSYNPDYDQSSTEILLQPGKYVTWPQYSPHRIVNEDCLNISLTCEYLTHASQVRTGAVYFNGLMRRRFGLSAQTPARATAAAHVKWALGRAVRPVLGGSIEQNKTPICFKVDLNAPRCVLEGEQAAE